MKASINKERLVIIQSSFNVVCLSDKRSSLDIFTIVRRQPSLLFKSALIINLLGGPVSIAKKLSDFYFISAKSNRSVVKGIMLKKIKQPLTQNDRSRITNVTFGTSFKISILIVDILRIIKRARLENVYDFFNFPVKFNASLELSYKEFIVMSMYSNKNAKATK